jgi:hypothetical protein
MDVTVVAITSSVVVKKRVSSLILESRNLMKKAVVSQRGMIIKSQNANRIGNCPTTVLSNASAKVKIKARRTLPTRSIR